MNDASNDRSRHGGARKGAGRRRRPRDATSLDRATVDLLLADIAPDQIETAAQRYARVAILALVKKLLSAGSESARVTAANAILDRGYGKPAVDIGGDAPQLGLFPKSAVLAGFEMVSVDIRAEARKFANLAIEVLLRIAEFGRSESAAVSASTSLLDRGIGKVGTAKMPEEFKETRLGKKEAAAKAAVTAATGRYATPAPPGVKRSDDETEH